MSLTSNSATTEVKKKRLRQTVHIFSVPYFCMLGDNNCLLMSFYRLYTLHNPNRSVSQTQHKAATRHSTGVAGVHFGKITNR